MRKYIKILSAVAAIFLIAVASSTTGQGSAYIFSADINSNF